MEGTQKIQYQVGEAWKGAYNSATNYSYANVVQDPTGLSVYRSLKSGNVGHPLTDTTWWFKIIDMSSIKSESDRIVALNTAIAEAEALRVAAEEAREQQAAADHETASADHTQAGTDHTTAQSDHTTAGTDHQTASTDHQQATADHSQYTTDHGKELEREQAETLREQAETQRAIAENNRAATETERHTQYTSDHSTYASDHITAAADHTQAVNDHTASADATVKASNVNATISGMIVTITDKNGVSTSVNIGFDITKTYASVSSMNADAANVEEGTFVMIATTDTTSTENARLYVRNSNATSSETPFTFLCDLDQAATSAWADWFNNYKPTIESDHTRAENDHTQASTDHTQASTDHTTADADHTTASADHTTASADHTTASADHTTASADHTLAESDHTRAESDHAAVEVYVDSLGVFDLSKHNAVGGVLATYADLSAAITALNDLESKYKYGGMSFKFIQSSNNKYVMYRLTTDEFSTDVEDWEQAASASQLDELEDNVVMTGSYDATVAVGLADNLRGDAIVSAEFYKRKTGGTQSVGSGIAAIKEVRGNSIVWNQLVDVNTTEVATISGRKYLTKINGVKSIITSTGAAITINDDSVDQVFDLTLMALPGISIANFEKMFPFERYDYSAGTIISFAGQNLVTTGKNQYNPVTGKANLLGGQTYQISGTYTSATIDGVAVTLDSNNCFTTTQDCLIDVTGGNDTNTFIGLYNGETNTYEPYEKHTLPLDPSQWRNKQGDLVFPYGGMHSIGSVYDYAKVDADGYIRKAVRYFGQVDLGSLNWSYNSQKLYFSANVYGMVNNESFCIMCSKYIVTQGSVIFNNAQAQNKKIGTNYLVSSSPGVMVSDQNYTDATTFKAAMQGVQLVYKRNTPKEVELATPIYAKYLCDKDGTEEITPANGTTPYTAMANLSILYAMDARGEIKNLSKNYLSKESAENMLNAMVSAGVIASYTMTYDAANARYQFTIVAP